MALRLTWTVATGSYKSVELAFIAMYCTGRLCRLAERGRPVGARRGRGESYNCGGATGSARDFWNGVGGKLAAADIDFQGGLFVLIFSFSIVLTAGLETSCCGDSVL